MNRAEISNRLIHGHQSFIDFISSLSDDELMVSHNGKWSPVQQLEHIYLCLRPIRLAVTLPKFIPAILFGKSKEGSRSYDCLVEAYQIKLKNGGKSPSIYKPQKSLSNIDKKKMDLIHLVNSVCNRLVYYKENELDTILLPHPLLGKITIRELLYFAIYHVGHHKKQILA